MAAETLRGASWPRGFPSLPVPQATTKGGEKRKKEEREPCMPEKEGVGEVKEEEEDPTHSREASKRAGSAWW